jgi:hypothetical protein
MTDLATHARDFAQNLALEAALKSHQAAGQQHAIECKSGNWCSALERRTGEHLHFRLVKTTARSSLGEVFRTLKSSPEPPA